MRSVNKVILIGNLTRDPSVKVTSNNHKVVTFTIATNREWVSNGDKQSLAEFHNVVVWGRLADICEQYLKKGKLVYIEGYLKTRYWESPENAEVRFSKTEIVAYDMIMLDKRLQDGEDYMPSMDDRNTVVADNDVPAAVTDDESLDSEMPK